MIHLVVLLVVQDILLLHNNDISYINHDNHDEGSGAVLSSLERDGKGEGRKRNNRVNLFVSGMNVDDVVTNGDFDVTLLENTKNTNVQRTRGNVLNKKSKIKKSASDTTADTTADTKTHDHDNDDVEMITQEMINLILKKIKPGGGNSKNGSRSSTSSTSSTRSSNTYKSMKSKKKRKHKYPSGTKASSSSSSSSSTSSTNNNNVNPLDTMSTEVTVTIPGYGKAEGRRETAVDIWKGIVRNLFLKHFFFCVC